MPRGQIANRLAQMILGLVGLVSELNPVEAVLIENLGFTLKLKSPSLSYYLYNDDGVVVDDDNKNNNKNNSTSRTRII